VQRTVSIVGAIECIAIRGERYGIHVAAVAMDESVLVPPQACPVPFVDFPAVQIHIKRAIVVNYQGLATHPIPSSFQLGMDRVCFPSAGRSKRVLVIAYARQNLTSANGDASLVKILTQRRDRSYQDCDKGKTQK
jgi:hypothetical protein